MIPSLWLSCLNARIASVNDEALLIAGLTVGTLISSAVVTGAAAPSAEAKPLVRTDHSWKDILGESTRAFAASSLVLADDSG